MMMVREPIVAGAFYPRTSSKCLEEVRQCIPKDLDLSAVPAEPVGGIVPHAGWAYSGPVAGRVFAALAARRSPKTFVLFGAAHTLASRRPAVFAEGAWQTPLGQIQIDQRLAERICSQTNLVEAEPYAHENEHSIEVQLPFIQHLFAQATILPIVVPPIRNAHEVGEAVARTARTYGADVLFVGSTDLTHYGPRYSFTPQGTGPEAVRWAKEVNDRRLLDLVVAMQAEQVVAEAQANHNACGAGAVAATIAACKQAGATQAVILGHTTSSEVMSRQAFGAEEDSVGYAGVIFG